MDVQVLQQLLAADHAFEWQRVGDHVQRVVGYIDQAAPIQRLQIGFLAGPFFGHAPGPAWLAGRVFVDRHAAVDLLRQAVQRAVIIIRDQIALQEPQLLDQFDHGACHSHAWRRLDFPVWV